ncbi:scytalone dehydratase [Exophiala aquamarina CBS 119918]|uniref:Scytalone dehydratase n=1 Tax=Exophiala aquamarina CBS 119918 TaxID=1182545 RepID=A0A072P419_9EURO|nr:scytalone dehydratase [Exophiala aquamarina CBS 119918]KEF54829.1 scytalone dehydratase [Exophiala aquamarina CBS 119918]
MEYLGLGSVAGHCGSNIGSQKWDEMPSEEFVGMVSSEGFVGDPLVDTQHFIGASKFERVSDDEVFGHHQLRAAHQRYTKSDKKEVEAKGHGHALMRHYYKKVDGQWKLAGLRPTVRWNEYDFHKIFKVH